MVKRAGRRRKPIGAVLSAVELGMYGRRAKPAGYGRTKRGKKGKGRRRVR